MSGKPEMDENHFSGADISCVLHATEDENNVLKSASETFSISKDRFFFKRLEGHWGNPIIYLIALLDSKEAWTTALKIMLSLNPLERNQSKGIGSMIWWMKKVTCTLDSINKECVEVK